jgi:DNA-binding IclR family transcriptional regulator
MRNGQIDRMVAVYAVLRASRPMHIDDIHHEVQEKLGEQFCERTTRRYLEALERLGMAERFADRRWAITSQLAFFETAAILRGARGAA